MNFATNLTGVPLVCLRDRLWAKQMICQFEAGGGRENSNQYRYWRSALLSGQGPFHPQTPIQTWNTLEQFLRCQRTDETRRLILGERLLDGPRQEGEG